MTVAEVRLWGSRIGAVSWDSARQHAFFEYDPAFRGSGIELAPLMMPLGDRIYSFPGLARETFLGLPGLLADSLPDRFGNAVIDAWLATQGRARGSFDPVERLCYTGSRGMGALEYHPARGPTARATKRLDVEALVDLAGAILARREGLTGSLDLDEREEALLDILRVGTSAGGARAKAVIAWNPATDEVRSGQVQAPPGFSYWILKFDGVTNRDHELTDPEGYGLVEYAYHLMARAAGVEMTDCRLLEEGPRRHFMTRRFDRGPRGDKTHMQSLCGLGHFDFNLPGAHSYEQALLVLQQLELPMSSKEQQVRRMVFNVVARNQDDHAKNIALLMDRSGRWSLSPAFDVIYSFNPEGRWTGQHQMTINGKRDHFELADIVACAEVASLKRGRAEAIVAEVTAAVRQWPVFAAAAGVPEGRAREIFLTHRTQIQGRRRELTASMI